MTTSIQQFDFGLDLEQVLLWQYNDALRLQSVIQSKQLWVDENQEQFWSDWYDDVFNLITANDFGLMVWTIILGLPIGAPATPKAGLSWGFGPYRKNFDNGNFAPSKNGSQWFSREDRRILLRLRALQLFNNGSIQSINPYLTDIIGAPSYMTDNLDMSVTFTFTGKVSPKLAQAMLEYNVLPRPSTVGIKLMIYNTGSAFFGFDDQTGSAGFSDDGVTGGVWQEVIEVTA